MRDFGGERLRAGSALRTAFALDLIFTGFEIFLTMVVLLLGRAPRRARRCTGFPRDWGDSGKLQIITCAYRASRFTADSVPGQSPLASTFRLFDGELRGGSPTGFGVVATLLCVQPIPLHSFDKFYFQ
jgi:hypothetical protein